MNLELLKHITDYMDFLIHYFGLSISCHVTNDLAEYYQAIYVYNMHNNQYCDYIKSNPKSFEICLAKKKVVQNYALENGAFCGTCWAGVEEYVFPLQSNEISFGFISVTNYKCTDQVKLEQKINYISNHLGLPPSTLIKKYATLKTNSTSIGELERLIYPLCEMFELLYIKTQQRKLRGEVQIDDSNTRTYRIIIDYICNNYNKNIKSSDIADYCGFSESFVRHLFNSKSDYTIKEYITLLRIRRAQELLANTGRSVSSIADEVGYNDSNYFTNVFKRQIGISPLKYRQNHSSPSLKKDNYRTLKS